MHLIVIVCLLFLYICPFYTDGILASSGHGKPVIMSEFETIIEANQNHTVLCQGNKPLKWTFPPVEEDKHFWTTFKIVSEKPLNSSYRFGSRLQIINMSYPFIGFYYCEHNNSDIKNKDERARIYLYVNDSDHLTTLKLNPVINGVIVMMDQEAVLPCKPTSPDVRVTLRTFDDGQKVPLDVLSSFKTVYHYNPLYGFSTNDTRMSRSETFQCDFSTPSKNQMAIIELKIEERIDKLSEPLMGDLSDGHTVVGGNLRLECKINLNTKSLINKVYFHWELPNKKGNKDRILKKYQLRKPFHVNALTIINATKSDSGSYFCNVSDHQNHSSVAKLDVKIFDVTENFLTVKEENPRYTKASAGDPSAQWKVVVKGHPIPKVVWFNNKNETIRMENGTKYEAYYIPNKNKAFLKIKNVDIKDMGNFILQATNNRTEKLTFFLNVTAEPRVTLDVNPFQLVNSKSRVKCHALGNPEPDFQWYLKTCQSTACDYTPINGTVSRIKEYEFISETTIITNQSGYIKCLATNYKGNSSATQGFYVSDISNGFAVYSSDSDVDVNEREKTVTIANGDSAAVICGAAKQNYSDIKWLFRNQPLINNRYELTNTNTIYSNKVELKIQHAQVSDSGFYSCQVRDNNGNYLFQNMTFKVANPEPPKIVNSTLQGEKKLNLPDGLVLYCKVSGIPKPIVTWFKNGVPFHPSEPRRIQISEDNEKIVISKTIEQDEGKYRCEAKNRMGTVQKQQIVTFKNGLQTNHTWLFTIIGLLSLVSIGTIIFIVIKIRKERELQRKLRLLGLANFEKGAVENINPELGIDEQAELLPYDKKWEFPIEHLKLGKQLGSGAFGVVIKGVAKNLVEGEEETTVAVKMVKKNADHIYIKALASELKIMVHLGKHLNVVNLLGACTKNVAKRELLVIVEFCRFGNLQNYIFKHRDNYIDQVDPKTGKIDYIIGQAFFDRTYSVSSDNSNAQSPLLKYAALTFSNISNRMNSPPSNSGYYKTNTNSDPSTTDGTTPSQGEEGVVISNNSVQPDWRSNYRGDYKGNVKPICTKDLLAWSFQVARGMEYLVSRKVLHGDLAARNILLADNNIVKICDFGLAKSIYKNDNYKKKGNGPLPMKWMAIESIRDRVFSTQSDVWSFGIVLWEFFSLARTPYPGMEADERLYQKLLDGYRMEQPQYAPNELYKMMTDCWSSTPLARPSFAKLSERLGNLLEETMKNYYIDLNDPYLAMNTKRLGDGHSDYLAMLNSPTFEALSSPFSSPHYVNEMVGQESFEDSGYLSMKPSTIFSPRVNEGSVFNFNVNNRKPSGSDGKPMELMPMLRNASDSGCEMSLQSPTTPDSFSNPSYHMVPDVKKEDTDGKIVKSPENYINMPQSKERTMNQNNSSLSSNNEKSNEHYVNSSSRDWESARA